MTMVTETRDVIEEREEHCSTCVTSTTMNYRKQNGTNSIIIEDNELYNVPASVKNVHLNGPAQRDETCAIGSSEPEVTKSCVQTPTSTENTCLLNGKCYHRNEVCLLAHPRGGGGWNLKKHRF